MLIADLHGRACRSWIYSQGHVDKTKRRAASAREDEAPGSVCYVLCLYLTFSMLCATSVCSFFCVEGFQGAAFPLPHNLCICFMRRNLADSMELAEAETEFGFGARQLNLLTRAFFEHHRHETKPEIIEDALNEGFDALHLITCSTQKRKWAFRYSAFPYQNRHQTMEKYLRDVHDAGRRPSALPQVGRRGNLVWYPSTSPGPHSHPA